MKYCNFCGIKMLDREEKCRVCGKLQDDNAEIVELPAEKQLELPETDAEPLIELCPYCRSEIADISQQFLCPYCRTPHHKECWDAKNECSVFSCYSKRHTSTSVGDVGHTGIIQNVKTGFLRNRKRNLLAIAILLVFCLLAIIVTGNWEFICQTPSQIMKKIANSKAIVTSVSTAETSGKLVAGLSDGGFELWDIKRATPLSKVDAFNNPLEFALIAPKTAKEVATGADGGETKIFSTSNSALLRTLRIGTERVCSASYTDSGSKLITGNQVGEIAVYNSQQGELLLRKKIHQGAVLALAATKKDTIISIGKDQQLLFSDGENGKEIKGITLSFSPLNWAFSNDRNMIALANSKGELSLFNAQTGKLVLEGLAIGGVAAIAVKNDGTIVVANADGQISIIAIDGTIKSKFSAGKNGSIAVLSLDATENKIFTAGKSLVIKQWNLTTQKCIMALARHKIWMEDAAVSRDGALIAVGQANGSIKIIDADSGEIVETLTGHSELVRSVAFSEDGKRLVSGSDDKTVKVWNLATGKSKDLSGHKGWVKSVAFSPDGKVVASGSFDSTVKIWNAETGEEEHNLTGHDAWVRDVKFSPDGKTLATCGDDKQIKIWNVATGECEKTLTGHERWVNDVQFSEDGKKLISSGGDGAEKVWDIDTEKCLNTIQEQNDLRNSMIYAADGKMFAEKATCEFCGQEIRPGDVIAICDNCKAPQHIACWRENGSKCVVCGQNISKPQEIGVDFARMYNNQRAGRNEWLQKLFERNTGSNKSIFNNVKVLLASVFVVLLILIAITYYLVKQPRVRTIVAHNYWIEALKFSPDGKYLASGSGDGTAKIWSAATGSFIRTLKASNYPIEAVVFLGNGETLATAGWEKIVRIWQVANGNNIGSCAGHLQMIYSLATSRKGDVLVSSAGDNTIKIWDFANQSCEKIIRGHISSVFGVAVSPDGNAIASCSNDRSVKVWDFDGNLLIALAGHDAAVRCVDFHPNGYLLASASDEGDIIIWNQKTGERLKTLSGHGKRVRAVAFSHSGEMLASAGDDNLVIVWNIHNGSQIEVLKGHTDRVCAVAFSVDDKRVASGGDDRVIKIWRLKHPFRRKNY
ncbi:MAG: RING finger protein [Bacillota bacterium]